MKFKRLTSAALALVMAAALIPAALADGPEVVELPLPKTYQTQLFLNGETLDASALPGTAPNLLPMRLLCEADGGMAEWYEEDNEAFFYLANQRIIVSFADNSVTLEFEPVEGVKATLVDGVTFLPASFVNTLEGVEVNENPELSVDRIDVKTPNGTPLMKLASKLQEAAGMGMGMQSTPADLEAVYGESLGFKAEYMTEGVAFLPMMVSADTLLVGKLAPDAEKDLKAFCDSYQAQQKEIFTTYLPQNLPAIENAKFATEGDWFMFLIAENADAAVELFHAQAAELK